MSSLELAEPGLDLAIGMLTIKVPPRIHRWTKRLRARSDESAFAASNSALFRGACYRWIATGGMSGARIIKHDFHATYLDLDVNKFTSTEIPVGNKTATSGAFSLVFSPKQNTQDNSKCETTAVVVGGDYQAPESPLSTAAYTTDGGVRR